MGKTAVVNLEESAVYVVKQGKMTKLSARDHGQDIIVWKRGEVLDVERSQRLRIEGLEVI